MAILEWDQVGERRYETGIDRGVLYTSPFNAIPWNGLVSVVENRSQEVKSYYMDGIKFLDHQVLGSYAAKLQAFTYPEELDALLGTSEFLPGIYLHDQRTKLFDLVYRTRIGNDLDGVDHGYKIHIIWNVRAKPSDFTYDTLTDTTSIKPFEWDLTAIPVTGQPGIRPTAHVSLDSRSMDPANLELLESKLYGSEFGEPELPTLLELLDMF